MLEIIFLLIILIQVCYYFILFSRFSFSKEPILLKANFPISVIICAKNESGNLQKFLPSIINQNYINFEIILVNDNSIDSTLDVMYSFKKDTNNIRIVNLSESESNKKNAITEGIKASKHEYLLFIDADCKPNSNNWINEMSAHFNDSNDIVLGYGAYRKIDKSWLNKLIRFETLLTAIQYFSYAKANLTYMGVGRNLAYIKSIFKKADGFKSHQHIKSGDDDLFINQVANNNTSCCYSKDSFTISEPHLSFKKWLYQKRRHISTANSYKPIHQFLLGLFFMSQFLFWFLGFYLLITSEIKATIALLFTLRILLQYLVFGFSSKKLNENDLILYLPFLELFLILIQMRIFIQNLFFKPTKW